MAYDEHGRWYFDEDEASGAAPMPPGRGPIPTPVPQPGRGVPPPLPVPPPEEPPPGAPQAPTAPQPVGTGAVARPGNELPPGVWGPPETDPNTGAIFQRLITGGGGDGSGGSGGGGFQWSDLGSDFGAPPAPFGERYANPVRPAWLQGEYRPETWNETYRPPSMEDVTNEPGFQTGLNTGLQARDRSAAARGSILSGGHQKALTRFGSDYGTTKFAESNARLFDQYKERYGAFQDRVGNNLTARGVNEAAFQTDSAQALTGYNTRYTAYLNDILNTRNAETDFWNRNQDQIRNGLTASSLARPPV